MRTVADKAGVSTATVSRVLNNPDVVDQKTRTLVNKAIAVLNYLPNTVARGLASKSSKTIGVVVGSFLSAYFGELFTGIDEALAELDYLTIGESSRAGQQGQEKAWLSLLSRQCESVIVHADGMPLPLLTEMMDKYPRSVLLNGPLKGYEERCVCLDNIDAGKRVADFLIDKGHVKLAMVTGPQELGEFRERSSGFVSRIEERELSIDKKMIYEGKLLEIDGQKAMASLLDASEEFTAVFFQNDYMATGGMELCRSRGIDVPRQLSIIGFDDVKYTEYLTPKLTTVHQPTRYIGAAAAKLAHAISNGLDNVEHIQRIFKADIVERDSVASLPK